MISPFKRNNACKIKCLNIIEQDYRFVKLKIKPMLGFDSFIIIKILLSSCYKPIKILNSYVNILNSWKSSFIL
jgi:hypothetical protein